MSTPHFSQDAGGTPTADGRFVDVSAIQPVEFVPGLAFQPVLGETSWVPHGARTTDTPCKEIDMFAPPRVTLVEHARAQQHVDESPV